MSEVHVVAVLTPATGKFDRVKDLLTGLTTKVHQNEPDVPKYQLFEQTNAESAPVLVVQEIYKDKATYDAHFQTDYFKALGKSIQEENLLAAPLDIKTIKPVAGFTSR